MSLWGQEPFDKFTGCEPLTIPSVKRTHKWWEQEVTCKGHLFFCSPTLLILFPPSGVPFPLLLAWLIPFQPSENSSTIFSRKPSLNPQVGCKMLLVFLFPKLWFCCGSDPLLCLARWLKLETLGVLHVPHVCMLCVQHKHTGWALHPSRAAGCSVCTTWLLLSMALSTKWSPTVGEQNCALKL